MYRVVFVTLLSTVGFLSFHADSDACGRRRHCSLNRSCCAPVCIQGGSQARAPLQLRKPLLQTDVLTLPGGQSHRLLTIDDLGWQEPVKARAAQPEALAATSGATGEVFNGNDREAAKTDRASATVEPFDDLPGVVATLPSDHFMRNEHKPLISKDSTSGRVVEEQRNVTVTAYLVATKKESDNDFHLILASTPGGDGPYLTAEVSGLPRTRTAQKKSAFGAVRTQYRDLLQGHVPGARYQLIDPPLPVTVTGSLFYDMDHPAGAVGTHDFVPATSWEIHPLSSITLAQ